MRRHHGSAVFGLCRAVRERHSPSEPDGVRDHEKPGPNDGISPIVNMDAHQTMVTAALTAKTSAETPKNA